MNKLLFLAVVLAATITLANCNCYKNWSRCTPQTKFWTGILWKSCPDYCKQCKGYSSGSCKRVHNKECSGGYQCRCNGRKVKPSSNLLVKATCKLGL